MQDRELTQNASRVHHNNEITSSITSGLHSAGFGLPAQPSKRGSRRVPTMGTQYWSPATNVVAGLRCIHSRSGSLDGLYRRNVGSDLSGVEVHPELQVTHPHLFSFHSLLPECYLSAGVTSLF